MANFYYGFPDAIEETGEFIGVFPEGQCLIEHGDCRWNAGYPAGTLDDVGLFFFFQQKSGFFDALINFLHDTPIINQVNVDLERVFLTGVSEGAYMAYRYSHESSVSVCGIAPWAGHDVYCNGGGNNDHVHVLHMHGDADVNVPMEGSKGSYICNIENYLEINECPDTVYTVNDELFDLDNTVKMIEYSNDQPCPEDGKVRGLIFIGQSHSWPSVPNGRNPTTFAIGATNMPHLIWNLLKNMAAIECVPRCLNGGTCNSGTCECVSGYSGDYCGIGDGPIPDDDDDDTGSGNLSDYTGIIVGVSLGGAFIVAVPLLIVVGILLWLFACPKCSFIQKKSGEK